MTETTKKNLMILANALIFISCMSLVVWGQRTVGYRYLFIQLIGLAGLLIQLWKYNQKFK